MQATTTRPKVTVTTDGAGVVSHAGTRLLADLADATTLTGELSEALVGVRGSRPRHDPGRVLIDLAVAIADGAEAISDIAVLTDQPTLFDGRRLAQWPVRESRRLRPAFDAAGRR